MELANPSHWRVLIDRRKFLATEPLEMYADEWNAMCHTASEPIIALNVLASIQEHARLVVRQASLLRGDLAPLLAGREKWWRCVARFRSAYRHMMQVISLEFVATRVHTEVDQADLRRLCKSCGLTGLVRDKRGEVDIPHVVDDLLWQVNHDYEFSRSQIALMKRSYDAQVNYEAMRANDRLQRRMLWLTVVIALLTVATLVLTCLLLPENATGILVRLKHWLMRVL